MISIQEIKKERDLTAARLVKLDAAIKAFQEVCNHEWEPNGHDSHHNWEKCKLCGREDKA